MKLKSIEPVREDQALAWIAGLFQVPADTISPSTARSDIALWDSLGVLTVMASLDEDFGIVVSDADMRGMTCVADLLGVLRQYGKLM